MARDRASRPEAKPLRLFVAADIPEEIRKTLAEATIPLMESLPRARWVPPENWHVTLKFLGRTWPRLLGWVVGSVAAVAGDHRPFGSGLTELGAFPSPRRARVLWAGLDDPDGRFAAITRDLDASLQREFEPEKRDFTPHLTIARFAAPGPLPEGALAIRIEKTAFAVDRLVLYRSHLRRPAPVYEPIEEFPLSPG